MQELLIDDKDEEASIPWQIHVAEHEIGKSYGEVFVDMVKDNSLPALALGLLRSHPEGMPFVWTNPPLDTVLREEDLLYVLGDKAFGKWAYHEGRLPLTSGKVE